MERPMSQPFHASRSLTALEQDSTIIAAIAQLLDAVKFLFVHTTL
jgi:hypothetical protein